MKKIEIGCFSIFFILSIIYSYVSPKQTIEEIEVEKQITIQVEGKIERQCTFDHNPTIQEVFQQLDIVNHYGFEDYYQLEDNQRFYIPKDNGTFISLNHASKEEFMKIKGIGEIKAERFIAYQKEKGFHTIEDIMNIKGIGEKTYQRIRELLCL